MTATEPSRQPLIRLAPIEGKEWLAEDREAASRILNWVRDGFAVIGYQASGGSGNGPENVYSRKSAVDALSAAHRELARLLDRIAEVEIGIEDAPLPESTS